MAAPTGRAFRIPATITNRYRRRAWTTTSARKDSLWFRFQSDTGVQAAYTDPINPVFDAVSPQPLYSFAAGHTHVFSQNLVNYFNPAFSWYESLFGPSRPSENACRISDCFAGSVEPTRPSRRSEGLTIRGCRAGVPRASSLMTTWPGAVAPTNSGLAPTLAFSA
jgi:hypothetical protein